MKIRAERNKPNSQPNTKSGQTNWLCCLRCGAGYTDWLAGWLAETKTTNHKD